MYRSAILRQTRAFSTSVALRKGPVEATKDTIKQVDRTVSDAAVKGIEKGEEAAQAAKKAAGIGKDKAEEAAGDVKDKAKEAKDEASKKV